MTIGSSGSSDDLFYFRAVNTNAHDLHVPGHMVS